MPGPQPELHVGAAKLLDRGDDVEHCQLEDALGVVWAGGRAVRGPWSGWAHSLRCENTLEMTTHEIDATRLAELLELAPAGLIVRDFDTDTITFWSRGAEELYGWSRDEAIGQVTHRLLQTQFPVSREALDATLRRVGRWEGDLVHTRRSGERIVVASRQAVHAGERGLPAATLEINTDITQRKRMQANLRESEDRFRLLVDSVQDYAIFLLSPEGRVESWNAGAQRVKGYRPEEILGQPFARFYLPEDVAQGLPARLLARAAADGRVESEGWRVRKDGSRFWADVVITALRDELGGLRGFAKVTRDLTERKQNEAAELRRSRDQLSAILAGVAEGITVQEASGQMVYANDAAARLCGFSKAAELLATPGREVLSRFQIFDESGEPLAADRLPGRLALQGRPIPEILVRFRVLATGEERWSLVGATPVADADGQVQLSVTIFRDVTERHRAEETARFMAAASAELGGSLEFEKTFGRIAQLAVPTLADWCVVDVIQADGRARRLAAAHVDPTKVQWARELAERYPEDQAAPHGVAHVLRTGQPELIAEISDEQLQAGARDAEHLAVLRSLQLRSVIIVPLVAHGRTLGAMTLVAAESGRRYGPHELAMAQDLAVRAALAADNARLYREAQQSVVARDEFLASASHDLKNPIAAIKASAQLLQRRLGRAGQLDPEQLHLGLHRIDTIATRAASQVDELLDVARFQMGQPLDLESAPTDLVVLAREIVDEHQQRTDRHQIALVAQVDELVGTWDRRRLCRVLGNLLDNAIKYSPEGGPIRVQVGREIGTAAWAVLAVEDHGIGIPQGDVERVFGRFQRGRNVIGEIAGSGIGLASARQIVETHGGTLTAVSRPGEGTTFSIRLPVHEPGEHAGA